MTWRRDINRFKNGIKVRIRLGIFDGFRQQVYRDRMSSKSQRPDWNDPYWQKLLCDSIIVQSFSDELLLGFTETAEFTYLRVEQPTYQEIINAVDFVLRQQDAALRKLYGELIDEKEKDTTRNKETVPTV